MKRVNEENNGETVYNVQCTHGEIINEGILKSKLMHSGPVRVEYSIVNEEMEFTIFINV